MFIITELGPVGAIVIAIVLGGALLCFLFAGALEAIAGHKGRIDYKTGSIQALLRGFPSRLRTC